MGSSQACLGAGIGRVAAEKTIEQEAELIQPGRLQPPFDGPERPFDDHRHGDRRARDAGQRTALERHGFAPEVDLSDSNTTKAWPQLPPAPSPVRSYPPP